MLTAMIISNLKNNTGEEYAKNGCYVEKLPFVVFPFRPSVPEAG